MSRTRFVAIAHVPGAAGPRFCGHIHRNRTLANRCKVHLERRLACTCRALPAPGERFVLCGRHAVELLAVVSPMAPVAEPPAVELPAAPAPKPAPSRRELQIREYAEQLEREGYSHAAALETATEALKPFNRKREAAARRAEPVVSRAFLRGVLLEQAGSRRGDAE